jgi:single-strand DNA-binding protein
MDNHVTLCGNLTADPELKYTPGGHPVAAFGLAVTRRWLNRNTQLFEEATSYFDVACWRDLGENVSASLHRGDRVVVTGRLEQERWAAPDGSNRTKVSVLADDVGASLRWAEAEITRNDREAPGVASTSEGVPF